MKPRAVDPVELAIFQSAVHSIAEEMGAALRRTALSPNIKERRDYSCAIFDDQARVIAMGDHMPVHLGSMPMSVQAAVAAIDFAPWDIAILNDPYAGGTHLPDITMVLPVFLPERLNRPSMFPIELTTPMSVDDLRFDGRPKRFFRKAYAFHGPDCARWQARSRDSGLDSDECPHTHGTRGRSSIADWRLPRGERRILEVVAKFGEQRLHALVEELLDYSERLVRAQLRSMPEGEFSAEDWMDDDGVTDVPRRIAVRLRLDPVAGNIQVDFAGSSDQVAGSVNAVRAITLSACFYVLRCLLAEDAPATAGILRPLTLDTSPGSIVDALPPAAVAGGNVETSQRIVDVLLRALAKAIPDRIPAASAGTMSNLTIGGVDPRTGDPFTYYETAAGGMGARPGIDGISGVQTHMTNSLNTPIEALEYAYHCACAVTPTAMNRVAQASSAGGGLIRELELLAPVQLTLLAERRRFRPYGSREEMQGQRGSMVCEGRHNRGDAVAGKMQSTG